MFFISNFRNSKKVNEDVLLTKTSVSWALDLIIILLDLLDKIFNNIQCLAFSEVLVKYPLSS